MDQSYSGLIQKVFIKGRARQGACDESIERQQSAINFHLQLEKPQRAPLRPSQCW